jgi:hypothetical protein
MTRTIDLTPEVETALARKAARLGLDLDAYLRRLVETDAAGFPATDMQTDPLIALMRAWNEEDAAMTPEEQEQADRDWEELQATVTGAT